MERLTKYNSHGGIDCADVQAALVRLANLEDFMEPEKPRFEYPNSFFCGECGFEIEVNNEFCPECGRPIDWHEE